MTISIEVPVTKASAEMIRIMQNVCIGITADNLRQVDEKLTKHGEKKVNEKLAFGFKFL